jgi:amino acid adenylation domain-containing protein
VTPLRRPDTVHAAFRRQVLANPAAVALRTPERTLSYADLDEASDACAAMLRGHGAGSGRRVGLLLPRSADAIIAMLGTLKTGAAFVPLDPDYPPATLAAMLRDCDPAVVVAAHDGLALPGGDGCWRGPVLGLESLDTWRSAGVAQPYGLCSPDSLAYVMYTSGSTGEPKGVMVPHRGILRLVIDADYVALGPDEVILQLAPLGFDACIFEIFGALLNGGVLAIETEPQPSLDRIASAIDTFGVTTMWLTAGLFHLMADRRPEALGVLRQLLVGGDVLSPAHVRRTLRLAPSCRLINGYGPTENTTFTCCHTIPPDWDGPGAVPIGRPINGTALRILDADLQPVPNGEAGQLCVAGDGVALGYLNRPALTRERFVPDAAGVMLYHTGDLVRRRADGVIEFLGRIDRQVKINGKRIELGGIEAALCEVPGVHDAVALLDEANGTKRILAFVVADAATAPAETLAAHLRDTLPNWMLPSRTIAVPSVPLTRNGKVDRAALLAASRDEAPVQAPRGATERDLARIWAAVLHVEAVDRERNFFDLGGTSLQILDLQEAIRRDLGHEVPVVALFAHSSVAALAAHLETRQEKAAPLTAARDRAGRQAEALRRLTRPAAAIRQDVAR